jgi:hypothetical protein
MTIAFNENLADGQSYDFPNLRIEVDRPNAHNYWRLRCMWHEVRFDLRYTNENAAADWIRAAINDQPSAYITALQATDYL